jgi:hypothetical protein
VRLLGAALVLVAMPALAEEEPREWSFSASAYAYFVPDDSNYVQPTVTADRARLHLEARYNYEARDTGSVWIGFNFAGGDTVSWELTPIVGAVVGDARGFAPGYETWLGWKRLELYSEGEYFIDTDASDDYFYNWSELTLTVVERFRLGLVTQRTRARDTDRSVERGLVAGYAFEHVDLAGYWFDSDDGDSTLALALGVEF